MKNSTRILWTLALVLLIAGVICAGGAYALGGFNLANLSTENAERFNVTYPVSDKILKITVNDSNTAVKFITGGQSEFSVSYVETKYHKYTITQNSISGGTELVINGREQRSGLSWIDYIGVMEVADKTLIITVPRDYDLFSLISITSSNGSVTVMDVGSDCEIYVKTSNASVTAENLNVSELSLTSSNGSMKLININITSDKPIIGKTSNASITCDNVTAESISLTSSNGSGKLYSVTASDDIMIRTSNASITADSVTCPSVSLTTSNGSIKANDITAERTFSASTSSASINVDNIDSYGITLTTSNGSVKGSVKGDRADYIITSHTSNGNNNLGDNSDDASSASAQRKLTVKTSNSNINVSFIK